MAAEGSGVGWRRHLASRPARGRLARPTLVLCALLLPLGAARPARSEPVNLELGAELGPQYDTNATRVVGASKRHAAPLLRLATDGALSWRTKRHSLAASYSIGGKLYLNGQGRPADELAQRASVNWLFRLGTASIGLGGYYYDSYLRGSAPGAPNPFVTRWDIRTGSPYAQLMLGDARRSVRAWLQTGYQGFQFKSQPDFDFHALVLKTGIQRTLSTGGELDPVDWVLSATYTASLRAFAGRALGQPELCADPSAGTCTYETTHARRDVDHLFRLRVNYNGPALASLWYALEVNESNSYGQSFVRHALGIEFTTPLVWELYLTARGVLQLSSFAEQLLAIVAGLQLPGLDQENRSRLILQLARSIGDMWSINVRYALFVNESGSRGRGSGNVPSYLRHTIFVGVRFEYDR